jgi:hypothetical protein
MTIEANRIESVTPPWILDPASRWVTVKEFASLYRRSVRRIQEMCRDGDIMVFQVTTYQDPQGRWWIRIPE